jgi:hypothetical protein
MGRTRRLEGMILGGAVLLAAGVLALEGTFAAVLQLDPAVDIALAGAGVLLLFTALFTLRLDRGADVFPRGPRPSSVGPSSGASLMALPSLRASGPSATPTSLLVEAPPSAAPAPPAATGLPARPTSVDAGGSTLLIPFAEENPASSSPPAAPAGARTVSQLVDRMDALQRASVSRPSPPSTPKSAPLAASLLHRLTRVPSPPATPSTPPVGRRCNDCGDPLGAPPRFEPCADCGRALCERCYWRTSSGPQAHLCTTCLRDRPVPRPTAPAATFPRPGPAASPSTASGRTTPLRRPSN